MRIRSLLRLILLIALAASVVGNVLLARKTMKLSRVEAPGEVTRGLADEERETGGGSFPQSAIKLGSLQTDEIEWSEGIRWIEVGKPPDGNVFFSRYDLWNEQAIDLEGEFNSDWLSALGLTSTESKELQDYFRDAWKHIEEAEILAARIQEERIRRRYPNLVERIDVRSLERERKVLVESVIGFSRSLFSDSEEFEVFRAVFTESDLIRCLGNRRWLSVYVIEPSPMLEFCEENFVPGFVPQPGSAGPGNSFWYHTLYHSGEKPMPTGVDRYDHLVDLPLIFENVFEP